MKILNNELYVLLKDFNQSIFPHLENVIEKPVTINEIKWVKNEDHFIRSNEAKIIWSIDLKNFIEIDEQLKKIYTKLINLIKSDNKLYRYCNNLAGNCIDLSRKTYDDIIKSITLNMLDLNQDMKFSQELFDSEYIKFEKDMYSDITIIQWLIPLIGFEAEFDELVLSENVKIKKLSDYEILFLLNSNILLGHDSHNFISSEYINSYSINLTYQVDKIFSDNTEHCKKEFMNIKKKTKETEDNILDFFRIYKQGNLYTLGYCFIPQYYLSKSYGYNYHGKPGVFDSKKYTLTKNEIPEVNEMWNKFTNIKLKYLKVAISRFSKAKNQKLFDDKIVDYCISAESLFLNDIQGELRFRLAIRAAFFLYNQFGYKEKIFNFFNKLYDLRSKIVHGVGETKLPKNEKNIDYTEKEFLDEIDLYLRETIKQFIHLSDKNKKELINWNKLILN